jgi:hypothetical protein
MADLRISCPHCNQEIACDELWAGHELACPTCQGAFMVPQVEAPAPEKHNPLVPKPPPGKPRLNLGPAPSKQAEAAGEQRMIPIRNLAPPPPPKKNVLLTVLKVVVVVAVVGAGAYFGLGYIMKIQEKANAQSRKEEANSDGGQVAHIANLNKVLDATETGGPGLASLAPDSGATRPRRRMPAAADPAAGGASTNTLPDTQQLPVIPAVWTLDVGTAKIPAGRANGTISGTNFVVETARIDVVSGTHVLRLLQGQLVSPDREILIYLHLKAGEKIGGQTLTISSDMKGSSVPQVAKRWKINPRYAPSLKSFYTGYAMKLELGQPVEGTLPGKIFLGLPDTEQSVVAGVFNATVNEPDPSQQPVYATPTATPTPGPDRSALERRYGLGGRR